MGNVTPKRRAPEKRRRKKGGMPWDAADPTRKHAINVPIEEPLLLMLDFLVEHLVIRSKSSFIREVVARAAEQEVARYLGKSE